MQWPHDDTASKNAFYGDFQLPGWADQNLIHILPPFTMLYAKQPLLHGILVHRKIAPTLQVIFQEIWNKCQHDQHQVDATGASDWGGCYNPRQIAGSDNWSNHSWACAVDISPTTNGFGAGHGTLGTTVVDAFKRQGAFWGGDYHGRTDPMHFEFVSR
jgi:hypothetical protein